MEIAPIAVPKYGYLPRKSAKLTLSVFVQKHLFINLINVKNFLQSLTTVVRAQNDTTKTGNITYTIFDRTLV